MKAYLCLGLLLLAKPLNVGAQNDAGASGYATEPPDFIHLSYEKANGAVKSEEDLIVGMKTKKIGSEYVSNVVHQLRYGNLNDTNKTLAVYFLGTFRPVDADSIEILIKNIDLKSPPLELPLWPGRWSEYPAMDALVKIGKPVVDHILRHLATEGKGLRRQLMLNVLKQVEGEAGARRRIEQGSDNLEAALREPGN